MILRRIPNRCGCWGTVVSLLYAPRVRFMRSNMRFWALDGNDIPIEFAYRTKPTPLNTTITQERYCRMYFFLGFLRLTYLRHSNSTNCRLKCSCHTLYCSILAALSAPFSNPWAKVRLCRRKLCISVKGQFSG